MIKLQLPSVYSQPPIMTKRKQPLRNISKFIKSQKLKSLT